MTDIKLHFDDSLPHQLAAIEAVCDLFNGQESNRTEFTVVRDARSSQLGLALEQGMEESALGIGNRLTLHDDEILANLHRVQLRNGLPPSPRLASGDFTVEMETGTGKTYVYLRTIFELRRRYGFTKFVVVVPSVAIKEGVYKTLRITAEHFRGLYANTPFEYFVYDSSRLGLVRNFATSQNIQIMIVTVSAINKFGDEDEARAEESDDARRREKSKNVMYRASERIGGEKPIDLIRATRPVVIVDEPQSVDGGLDGKGRKALARMNPLCTLRYSATHADKCHMVYRLDAVDAYEQKLVKQIEVASGTVEGAGNRPYVRLVSVKAARGSPSAVVELDVERNGHVARREVTVQDGDDLAQVAAREIYRNHGIGELRSGRGKEFMELRVPGDTIYLQPGEAWNDVDPLLVQQQMIRRTIKEHLDKEKRLRPRGIKVLSLFFIDEVARYRRYDAEGNAVKGPYAELFEKEYESLRKHPDYRALFEEPGMHHPAGMVHDGYFSVDRKKVGGRSVEQFKDTRGNTAADDDTYSLIMRDRERLLDLAEPLKFIFSHSALREGWDNPNVFQICALRDIRTERERRQSIGRGLRLCVNQQGDRVHGFEANTLTVVASERYEEFAEGLQRELEDPATGIGIRFGYVEKDQFAAVATTGEAGDIVALGPERSAALHAFLREKGYIGDRGKVEDVLRKAIKAGALELPPAFEPLRQPVTDILRKLCGRLEIKDADRRRTAIPVRRAVLDSPGFKELWDRIKHKTVYRVRFDSEDLIRKCAEAVRNQPAIARAKLQWRKAGLAIGRAGVEAGGQGDSETVFLHEADLVLPDILTELHDRTQLTRRSLHRILVDSGRLDDFTRNPQLFIERSADAINRCRRLAIVDGIEYRRIGDDSYYAQELFVENELSGYLDDMLKADKAVHEYVVLDSGVERDFAEALERNRAVKLYAKLPGWFKVPTPLGSYNPDWAILVDADGRDRLYFVVETKSSPFTEGMRRIESAKIDCGKAHFEAIAVGARPARYLVAGSLDDVLASVPDGAA